MIPFDAAQFAAHEAGVLPAVTPLDERTWALALPLPVGPPLYTLVTHVLQMISGPGLVVTRLAAMIGFLAAAVLLFLTVSHRTNAMLGGLAVLLLCATPAWDYAVEARGYGLSLAFFALALYAWTEAAAGRRAAFH